MEDCVILNLGSDLLLCLCTVWLLRNCWKGFVKFAENCIIYLIDLVIGVEQHYNLSF